LAKDPASYSPPKTPDSSLEVTLGDANIREHQ